MKPIFIEFSQKIEDYKLSQIQSLYDILFDKNRIFTNAYYTDEPSLEELVFKNDLIWMSSVVTQESQYAIDTFIKKFYVNKISGKTIVNTTGYLINHLKNHWAQQYPDRMQGAEFNYNSIQLDDERVTKWEILKWVLDNNTIVDESYDDYESYDLYIITMKKKFPEYDKREGEERMTPVLDKVYLKGER